MLLIEMLATATNLRAMLIVVLHRNSDTWKVSPPLALPVTLHMLLLSQLLFRRSRHISLVKETASSILGEG